MRREETTRSVIDLLKKGRNPSADGKAADRLVRKGIAERFTVTSGVRRRTLLRFTQAGRLKAFGVH